MDLKRVADDLAKIVGDVKRTESATQPQKVLTGRIEEDAFGKVARSAFGYVVSSLNEDDSADTIGKAMIVGATAAADDAKIDQGKAIQAMVAFLEEILASAKEMA